MFAFASSFANRRARRRTRRRDVPCADYRDAGRMEKRLVASAPQRLYGSALSETETVLLTFRDGPGAVDKF